VPLLESVEALALLVSTLGDGVEDSNLLNSFVEPTLGLGNVSLFDVVSQVLLFCMIVVASDIEGSWDYNV
jgi:hypothetical protein